MKKFDEWWSGELAKIEVNQCETERCDEVAKKAWDAAIESLRGGSSWFSGSCKKCGFSVVVTQSKEFDYFYYCSNKSCENHIGEELFDDDDGPEWAI